MGFITFYNQQSHHWGASPCNCFMGEFHGDKIHFLSNLLKNGTPIMIIMDDDNPQFNDSIMVVSTEKYEFVSWDYYSQLNGQKTKPLTR